VQTGKGEIPWSIGLNPYRVKPPSPRRRPRQAKPAADDEIARLRTSLSLLTTAGADLAAALEKRTREYESLLGQLNEATHQVEGLRAELQQDAADRNLPAASS